MNNFGVQEVANSKSIAAPGWAYVPDTGVNASVTALQPTSRKRARTQVASSHNDTTAKQDAKILRELAALDRENHRDVTIPVPIRHRDNAGRATHGKVTPAVRKILQSQKTFANHLSDFQALSILQPTSSTPSQPAPAATPTPAVRAKPGPSRSLTSKGTRSHKKKDPNAVSTPTPLRRVSSVSQTATPAPINPEPSDEVPMLDALTISMGTATVPATHPGDQDPLLTSHIPNIPSPAEIERLLAAPPLSYLEARGPLVHEDMRKPFRRFCEVCGYWGLVRCKTCGGRICALDCLRVHQEECFNRYGA